MPGDQFEIVYKGLTGIVTPVDIEGRNGYRISWPDDSLDFIYYDATTSRWESMTLLTEKDKVELGRLVREKVA